MHPGRYHRTLDQIPLIDFEVRRFHDRDPASFVGIVCDQAGVAQRIVIDGRDHAFNGREQIHARATAAEGDELLPLTNPAVLSAYVNVINLSHQVGNEFIHADPRIVGAFFHYPCVSKMKAIILRDIKPILALDAQGLRLGHDFGFQRRLHSGFDEISDSDDQKEHQQDKQD